MTGHDIVVIGGSAGSIEALQRLVADLPPDLPASIFIVVHFPANSTSVLPDILTRAGTLRARHAEDGEPIEPGRIYVAPPGCHLFVNLGRLRVSSGPKENGHRPAVDPLFRTAAQAYGPRVLGVVLSGNLDDGTAGLLAIKEAGGAAVVQDPADALYPSMPRSAVAHVPVDRVAPLAELSALITSLVGPNGAARTQRHEEEFMSDSFEPGPAEHDPLIEQTPDSDGVPSTFTCPECKGALWEVRRGGLTSYRCRVGHAFTGNILLQEQAQALEAALWTALRSLEEHAALARKMARSAGGRGHPDAASALTEQAMDSEHHASVIRGVLTHADETSDSTLSTNA
jgi:two-component system, chemotaxis family, protein-glutamate methylesterase/glutaminase